MKNIFFFSVGIIFRQVVPCKNFFTLEIRLQDVFFFFWCHPYHPSKVKWSAPHQQSTIFETKDGYYLAPILYRLLFSVDYTTRIKFSCNNSTLGRFPFNQNFWGNSGRWYRNCQWKFLEVPGAKLNRNEWMKPCLISGLMRLIRPLANIY